MTEDNREVIANKGELEEPSLKSSFTSVFKRSIINNGKGG